MAGDIAGHRRREGLPGGVFIRLAARESIARLRSADRNADIFTPSNPVIENPEAITHLKVRLELEPSGLRVTPDSLSIPGRRFDGTVRDNRVEGVFEVEVIDSGHVRIGHFQSLSSALNMPRSEIPERR